MERFGGGYTLESLEAEDARLWKLVQIEELGRPVDGADPLAGMN